MPEHPCVSSGELHRSLEPFYELIGIPAVAIYDPPGIRIADNCVKLAVVSGYFDEGDTEPPLGSERIIVGEGEGAEYAYAVEFDVIYTADGYAPPGPIPKGQRVLTAGAAK